MRFSIHAAIAAVVLSIAAPHAGAFRLSLKPKARKATKARKPTPTSRQQRTGVVWDLAPVKTSLETRKFRLKVTPGRLRAFARSSDVRWLTVAEEGWTDDASRYTLIEIAGTERPRFETIDHYAAYVPERPNGMITIARNLDRPANPWSNVTNWLRVDYRNQDWQASQLDTGRYHMIPIEKKAGALHYLLMPKRGTGGGLFLLKRGLRDAIAPLALGPLPPQGEPLPGDPGFAEDFSDEGVWVTEE